MWNASHIKSATDYRGFLTIILLRAPDNLKVEYRSPEDQLTLDIAFKTLYEKLPLVKSRVKSEVTLTVIKEMLKMAHESFEENDRKKACHIIQEIMGLIWPSVKLEKNYEYEAAKRLGIVA